MHPTDHMSTALVYLLEPNKISGALYQRVATYSVIIGSATDWFTVAIDRASPKSASFARQSESRRIFEGFKSRWMSYPECIYFMPFNTLTISIGTDRWHIFCAHFPWYLLWWLRASPSPWNRILGICLCCSQLWGYWAGRRYWDVRSVLAGRSPELQRNYFTVCALRISGVLECVKDLFKSNCLTSLFVDCLPNHSVGALSQLLEDLESAQDVWLEFLCHDR